MNRHFLSILLSLFSLLPIAATAAKPSQGVMNGAYADLRLWHLGFSVGTHLQDITIANTGATSYDGTEWYIEQPSYSPGFSVGTVADMRLSSFFNLRLTPSLHFGSRDITMRDATSDATRSLTLKSTYLALPLDLRYSALRYRNSRPYIAGGIMPAFDVAKRRAEPIMLRTSDVYLTVALGCDFYLPYFKLIPELKFCFGLTDVMRHNRPDLADDPSTMRFTNAVKRATSSMVILTFYFE